MITPVLSSLRLLATAIVFIFAMVPFSSGIAQERSIGKRVALVIGNGAYLHTSTLRNPANDATAMAVELQKLGFEVLSGMDMDGENTRTLIAEFARKLQGADVALFYYAGHGLQVGGGNYLVPVDATLKDEVDLQFQTIKLDFILRIMERDDRTSIVLLDACRDNPLARRLARSFSSTRSGTVADGLARMDSGVGTYIGFSTEPGNVALDGDGENSPFTTALVRNISKPNSDIESIMRIVRQEVVDATKGAQVPWGNSSLIGAGFYFNPVADAASTKGLETPAKPAAADIELAFWKAISSSQDVKLFQEYLDRFPKGAFAPIAQSRLDSLMTEKASAAGNQAEQLMASLESGQSDARDATADSANAALEEPGSDGAAELARGLQSEMNRLGCSAGVEDGKWGAKSRSALKRYAEAAGIELASLEPESSLLERMKTDKARICPLSCRSGYEEKNGKCERVAQPETEKRATSRTTSLSRKDPTTLKPTTSNATRPDAERYSRSIWPSGTLGNNERATAKTSFGTLVCIGGDNVCRGGSCGSRPRRCSWK